MALLGSLPSHTMAIVPRSVLLVNAGRASEASAHTALLVEAPEGGEAHLTARHQQACSVLRRWLGIQ